jgi:DNA-binding NarL/FixJ family response regulator
MTGKPVQVLIADGDASFRRVVRELADDTDDVTVVGEAGGGREAVALACDLGPDVILLDADMLGKDGLCPMQALSASSPESRIILSSATEQDDLVLNALKKGAWGHLIRGESERAEILDAIRVVNRGGTYLSPRVAGQVLDEIARGRRQKASVRD